MVTLRTVLRRAEVSGRIVDVVIADGVIAEMADAVRIGVDDHVVDASGAALLPGLHDHHVHLLAMAARRGGPDLDVFDTPAAFDDAIATAAAQTDAGWVRASGYDEHRHGELDRWRLDAVAPGAMIRVQHRTGLAWVLSSAALDDVGITADGTAVEALPDGVELDPRGEPTGRFLRLDSWLGDRVGARAPTLAPIGTELAAMGVTGITDATADLGPGRLSLLRAAARDGSLPQRLVLLGVDDPAAVEGWARLGPAKILMDEVHGLDPDAVAERIAEVHGLGRKVAIHAVTRAENVGAVTALALAGPMPGDRIEHGSVLPADLDPVLVAGGVVVVLQPSLVRERGDHHLSAVDASDLGSLHRAASLLAAGVAVAAGSDAPVTSPDPWAGIASAVDRITRSGRVLGPAECVDASTALDWYLTDPLDPGGPARRLRVGAPADLCLLDAPLHAVLADPDRRHVRMTWVAGRLVHA